MALEHYEGHEPTGTVKLAPPFWGKPRVASWLVALLAEVQTLETAIWSYVSGLDVDTCNRWILEGFAKIVGEDRRPASTDTLRTYVKGRIAVNQSDGTPSAIARLIAAVASAATVEVHEFDGHVRVLQTGGTEPDDPDAAAELLDEACAAAVSSCWVTDAGATSFALPTTGETDDARCMGTGTWSDYHG
jgi:hypothetical protein